MGVRIILVGSLSSSPCRKSQLQGGCIVLSGFLNDAGICSGLVIPSIPTSKMTPTLGQGRNSLCLVMGTLVLTFS